jgi:hypothetical protein
MNKWDKWRDSLSLNTKEWLKSQPIWHDSDLYKITLAAFVVGFIVGFIF